MAEDAEKPVDDDKMAEKISDREEKEKRTRGVTEAITESAATPADLKITGEMKEELERNHPTETPEGMKHRTFVLEELQRLAEEWVAEEAEKEGIQFTRPGVKVITFGSYRLGAVNPGSDIDTVLLGPKFVHREQFFSGMVPKLRNHKAVSSILPVPDAYTPVATLKFYDVEIDLLYSQLDFDSVPPDLNLTSDDTVLRGLDDQSLRSLNGCRVAEMIRSMVPDTAIYTDTLKFIKCWAKRRGIYSNVLGYFGGITWALCVARVCQLYPNYCMSLLVHRFFRVLDQWNWSKPILLCPVVEVSPTLAQIGTFKVWNPKVNPTDRNHLMPVITPAFPSMNSTHNVMESTKRIICDEIHRGYQICKDVECNKATYADLYAPAKFFTEYKNYLWIEIEAREEDAFRRYAGWVESKVRILVGNLEQVSGLRVHPYSRSCSWLTVDESKIPKEERGRFMNSWFIGLSFCHENGAFVGQTVDMRPAINPFIDVLQDWRDLATSEVKLRLKNVEAKNLPPFVHIQEDPLRATSSKIKSLRPQYNEAKRPRPEENEDIEAKKPR